MNTLTKLSWLLLIGAFSVAQAVTTGEELLRDALKVEQELRAKISIFERQPDFGPAIELYSKALSVGDLSSADRARALLNRANLYMAQGNCAAAIKDLDETLKMDAKQIQGYALRGTCRRQAKSFKEALEDFNKAVALAPRDAVLIRERASIHAALNDYDKAIQDYTETIKILKSVPSSDVFVERGDVFQARGQYERAISDYQRAVQIVKKHAATLSPENKTGDIRQLRPIYARLGDAYHALAAGKK